MDFDGRYLWALDAVNQFKQFDAYDFKLIQWFSSGDTVAGLCADGGFIWSGRIRAFVNRLRCYDHSGNMIKNIATKKFYDLCTDGKYLYTCWY